MHPALWVSKTGLTAQDTNLRIIANNLANVSTTGFKKDNGVFQDLLYQIRRQPGAASSQDTELPSGLQLGTGVRTAGTQKQFTQGSLEITENPLDLAIDGRGFFEILLPDGTTAYTRNGQFHLTSDGQVVDVDGNPLQPAITLPNQTRIVTVGRDGTVSAVVGTNPAPTQIGNITLTDFVNPPGLEAIGDNLFLETGASGTPQTATPGENGLGRLRQGIVENSNVNVVEELVDMITTQRAFEMNSKVVSTADQMLGFLSQTL